MRRLLQPYNTNTTCNSTSVGSCHLAQFLFLQVMLSTKAMYECWKYTLQLDRCSCILINPKLADRGIDALHKRLNVFQYLMHNSLTILPRINHDSTPRLTPKSLNTVRTRTCSTSVSYRSS